MQRAACGVACHGPSRAAVCTSMPRLAPCALSSRQLSRCAVAPRAPEPLCSTSSSSPSSPPCTAVPSASPTSSSWAAVAVASAASALQLLGPVSSAFAAGREDVDVSDAIAALAEPDAEARSLVVSVMFGAVITLLSLITLGVIYLSLSQWLDKRRDQEDQEAAKRGIQFTSGRTSGGSDSKTKKEFDEDDTDEILSLRKSSRVKPTGKGFGDTK